MQNILIKKILVLIIISLFIGLNTFESTGKDIGAKKYSSPYMLDKILYVGGNGTGNYTKIQDAIENASEGDTVFVFNESSPYYENVVVDKQIDLLGEDSLTTIVDGRRIGDVINILADLVDISGFTIRNSGKNKWDSGVNIISNFNTISENIILNNTIGILLNHSNDNGILNNNITKNNRSGIYLEKSVNDNIQGNIISNNYDSGISIVISSKNTILYNNISNNDNGIIIFLSKKNIISYNSIRSHRFYSLVISCSIYNIISDNIIFNSDYGISLDFLSNRNTISNNIVERNFAGIDIGHSRKNNISYNTIIDNSYGIGLWMCFKNKIFKNNISFNHVGIYLQENSARNHIFKNIISNNIKGIFVTYSKANKIYFNNFINNSRDAYIFSGIFFRSIKWFRNYWSKPRFFPTPIYGEMQILLFFFLDIIINYYWYDFDWFPAQEPYDIGV